MCVSGRGRRGHWWACRPGGLGVKRAKLGRTLVQPVLLKSDRGEVIVTALDLSDPTRLASQLKTYDTEACTQYMCTYVSRLGSACFNYNMVFPRTHPPPLSHA